MASAAHHGPCDTLAATSRKGGTHGGAGTLAATVLGSSLSFIDGSVVNVALPAMARDLGAGAAGVQWIVNAYLLPLAALVLLGGALSDRLGRKRVFMAGTTLFTLASLICLAAPSLEVLIAGRVAQGLGAALLVPASLAILGTDFEGEARGRAIGTWAAAGAVAGAIGPILGGWLVDAVGWRSIFAVILPVAAAALLLGWRYIDASQADEAAAPLDWRGALLATIGLGLVTFGLTSAASGGGAMASGTMAAGLVACIPFLWIERRLGERAMVPLALFGTRTFTGVTLLTLFLYAALGGVLLLLPYLLIARGWAASAAGAAMLPLAILMGLGSRGAGRLAERIGARPMLSIGPLVTGAGFAWLARLPEGAIDYWRDIFPAMMLIGIGMAIAVAPLTTTVMTAVDEKHAGAASGVNNATARIGAMLATALIGLALTDGGAGVSTPAFHIAALAAASGAVLAGLSGWLLVGEKTAR